MKTNRKETIISVITLGCSKNVVESEILMNQLKSNNVKISHDKFVKGSKAVIINTCGFIEDAKQQSIDTILQYVALKEKGKLENIYVIGCLSQRYKKDLEKSIPEVDSYFGSFQLQDIVKELGLEYKNELIGERLLSTPKHYAYLKISEGCDRTCSFCAIPLIKGKHVSKTIESLVKEAELLVKNGVKEIMLIAQDLTYYGIDIYKKQALPELLTKLSDIKGLEWIRLHYTYPAKFPLDVIKVMKEKKNICKYLDIPVQHISDNMLSKMHRNISKNDTIKLLNYIKTEIPEITLRTTILVGHPGESQADFKELQQFVSDFEFDRLGVFTYSHEEQTYSFENFKDDVPEKEKYRRKDELMSLQMEISYNKNHLKIGKNLKVIIDEKSDGNYIGRTESDSPDVDNRVIIKTEKTLKKGNFYKVKITACEEYDLIGTLI
ncbi:MAG: ribosomal protein S12 methylthiotransferase RimO [Bacteroidetes bacterium GWA2_31_9]|nr:MAG: ribosomal protein S12 methylthiotransferase RimO [Bacteroidetes bacterium GWA2_31_9]